MNQLTLPARDLRAAYLSEGLTAFSYERIEEALTEVQAAFAAYDEAWSGAEKAAQSTAAYGTTLVGWEGDMSEAGQTLLEALHAIEYAAPVVNHSTSREAFPVRNWKVGAATYRTLTKRIAKRVAAFRQESTQAA